MPRAAARPAPRIRRAKTIKAKTATVPALSRPATARMRQSRTIRRHPCRNPARWRFLQALWWRWELSVGARDLSGEVRFRHDRLANRLAIERILIAHIRHARIDRS